MRNAGGQLHQSHHFSLAPLAMAIESTALARFIADAPPGARIVYARGTVPPRDAPAWKAAGSAARLGLLHLVEDRSAAERLWIAERTAQTARPKSPAPLADDPRDEEIDRLRRALRRAVNLRLPGPTNDELARQCDLQNAERARYLLKRLIAAGEFRVRDNGPRQRRIFILMPEGRESMGGAL